MLLGFCVDSAWICRGRPLTQAGRSPWEHGPPFVALGRGVVIISGGYAQIPSDARTAPVPSRSLLWTVSTVAVSVGWLLARAATSAGCVGASPLFKCPRSLPSTLARACPVLSCPVLSSPALHCLSSVCLSRQVAVARPIPAAAPAPPSVFPSDLGPLHKPRRRPLVHACSALLSFPLPLPSPLARSPHLTSLDAPNACPPARLPLRCHKQASSTDGTGVP